MELRKKILEHGASLYAICYSTCLDLYLSGGADRIVASWDCEDFSNQSFSIKTDSAIFELQEINERYLFIGLFNGGFHIIDLVEKREIANIKKHSKGIFSSYYDSFKRVLFVGDGNGTLSTWSVPDCKLLQEHKISEGKIRAISGTNEHIYVGTSEGAILQSHDARNWTQSHQMADDGINSLCVLPKKSILLAGTKSAQLIALDINDNKIIHQIPAHNWPIYSIVQNEQLLITCSRDKTIKLWDKNSLTVKKRISWPEHKGHTASINKLLFDNNRKRLISVGDDKAICIWE